MNAGSWPSKESWIDQKLIQSVLGPSDSELPPNDLDRLKLTSTFSRNNFGKLAQMSETNEVIKYPKYDDSE